MSKLVVKQLESNLKLLLLNEPPIRACQMKTRRVRENEQTIPIYVDCAVHHQCMQLKKHDIDYWIGIW